LEILQGLEIAIKLGWYSFKDFDVQEYEYYEKVENGDLNWIIPNEVLAFMGPSGKSYDKNGQRLHTPEDYSKLFSALNVE
jgi:cell division cycle 14